MMKTTLRTNRGRQKGASLIFAMITLVSMMLAAIALVRSVDSGSRILGNIGFQQDATAAADLATRRATTWLTESGRDLTVNSANGEGFFATAPVNLDVTGQLSSPATRTLVNWDSNSCGGSSAACWEPRDLLEVSPGNSAKYVIFRLCQNPGAIGTSNCAQPLTSSGGDPSHNGSCSGGGGKCAATGSISGQYFRIVVRVTGSRDTTSFTETIVQY